MAYGRTAIAEIQKRVKELDKEESAFMWTIGRMKADLAAVESDMAAVHLKRSQYEIMLGMLDPDM